MVLNIHKYSFLLVEKIKYFAGIAGNNNFRRNPGPVLFSGPFPPGIPSSSAQQPRRDSMACVARDSLLNRKVCWRLLDIGGTHFEIRYASEDEETDAELHRRGIQDGPILRCHPGYGQKRNLHFFLLSSHFLASICFLHSSYFSLNSSLHRSISVSFFIRVL